MEITPFVMNVAIKYFAYAVADPGFSRGGGVNPPGGREHAKFSRKLHEIERIWTPRGGRASLTPPPDPPMLCYPQDLKAT